MVQNNMFKKLIICLFLIIGVHSFSAVQYAISDIVELLLKKSKYHQIELIEKEKLSIENKGLIYERWLSPEVSIVPQYRYYIDEKDNTYYWDNFNHETMSSSAARYTGNINLDINYKFLFFHVYYDHITSQIERNRGEGSYEVGFRQNINDLLYSDFKYRGKVLKIKEKTVKNQINKEKCRLIEDGIDLYTGIKNTELSIKIKENSKLENELELENMKKRFEKGEGVDLDIQYLEIEIENIKEEIELLNNSLLLLKKRISDLIGIEENENIIFTDITDIQRQNIENRNEELVAKELEIENSKENLKKIRIQELPNINTIASYDLEAERWIFRLEVNKTLNFYNQNSKLEKKNLIEKKFEKELIKQNIENEKNNREIMYQNFLKECSILEKRKENYDKRYILNKKLFDSGYIGVTEYIKLKNEYERVIIEYKKSKNNLMAFEYKNLYINRVFMEEQN